ncbi:MBL fold metallo-hydrolase [Peribacillus frigoritolerans]|uniref:MBL fold metallo-hydrolase n=1 Tax=Peribacillus frigoritolerans TaxID=450367 RepID=UPI0023DB14D5|nr:MBL fold metallo-hydrolase [Peribacillus frigoritolerans]MDF1997624.1 MBL fold metallo-hydrolase [Peribacillus frigoritolerans]
MKVDILASGSGGNVIAVRSSGNTILVDVGIAKTKIEKRLLEVGIRPDSIDAILITHAHSDHVKGLPLANKYQIPIFATEGEWKSIKGVNEELQHIIVGNMLVSDFDVTPFKVYHDAFEPVGYSIVDNVGDKVSICLDTGKADSEMIETMKYSNFYIIESNHEPAMLEHSNYPNSVKARILSDIGHLSNKQTAEALSKLVKGIGEKIYLTHLSSSNNMPELAKLTTIRALNKKELKAGTHYKIEVF